MGATFVAVFVPINDNTTKHFLKDLLKFLQTSRATLNITTLAEEIQIT